MIKLHDILFNRIYKKISIISSAVFIGISLLVAAGVVYFAQEYYRDNLKQRVVEFATIGAQQSQTMFTEAIDSGHVSHADVFDENYQRIGLAEFRATYISAEDAANISDSYVRKLMDRVVVKDADEYYRYHTAYDQNPFLNREALHVEEPFLKIQNIDYAVLIDRNGYIPFHHSVNSQPLTGDLERDTFGNRAKRIWRKTLGDTQVPGEFSFTYYRRDTGIPYLNVNAPIMIDGKYWGAFLVGYNATEIDVAVSELQRNLALLILVILVLTVTIYSVLIIVSLRPLSALLAGAQQIQEGNFDVSIPVKSGDEIGYLSKAFNNMVISISAAEKKLKASAAELKISNDKLEDYNQTLQERVSERTHDLNTKNQELEATLQKVHEMQGQLIMQEKMASLGNLVAGVAHEVNTPIGAVYSGTDTIRRCIERIGQTLESSTTLEELTADTKLQKSLKILSETNRVTSTACERIASIVKSLKTFARLDEAEYQETDIHTGIDSTLTLIDHEVKNRIEIVRRYGAIPAIHCYPNQLNQVFMNVLVNALQSIPESGQITISTYSDPHGVVVEISDTGTGIPERHIAKVFDPGFTTKGVGVGTGLGLSICHNIVRKHDGEINLTSIPGKGTCVQIRIPFGEQQIESVGKSA